MVHEDSSQRPDPISSPDGDDDVVERVLARSVDGGVGLTLFSSPAQALDAADGPDLGVVDEDERSRWEREDRQALRRVAGLSTELEDITEVEYRQVRLEKVVLIGVFSSSRAEAEHSLRELAALAQTAGAQVVDGMLQRRDRPDPGTYVGRGKARELADVVAAAGADTVVADNELAPSQRRALEDVVRVKVIDRTAVILDIFSQHAQSREGKAQVELAQLEYLLPRLRGWGRSMSRQAGGQIGGDGAGMGSRGPGETKLELDRRHIHSRIARLRKQIASMKPVRESLRANRRRNRVPSVAIVGYTNAGKSSLLNRLTDAGVLVENALFATLDATVRRATTPDGRAFTLTDTVGFVRALPHELIEAFRATLEEAAQADVVVHVVDASHPDPGGQLQAVREVLSQLTTTTQVELVAFNKSDLVSDEDRLVLRGLEPRASFVSAATGRGVDELYSAIVAALPDPDIEVDVVVPYDRGEVVAALHERARVLDIEYLETGTRVHALVDPALASTVSGFEAFDRSGSSEPQQSGGEGER